jgi:hypothetical protein
MLKIAYYDYYMSSFSRSFPLAVLCFIGFSVGNITLEAVSLRSIFDHNPLSNDQRRPL